MAVIVFFCRENYENLYLFEYYKQDIDALNNLGHKVVISTKYSEIPLKFDLMFVWWWTYAFFPVFLCKLLSKPILITGTFNFKFPDAFKGNDYFSRPWWQRLLIKYSVTNSSMNLFVNKKELVDCSNFFKLDNAFYFPHIIPEEYYIKNSEMKNFELFNISWSGKDNLLRKGVPDILQAVSILKKYGLEVKLNLAGKKGDGYSYLESLIENYNISSNVILLGEITKEEKIKYLKKCDIYVQPSNFEGFGLAIAEAMSCGACIITCDVGAVKDVVDDCAFFISPNNSLELANLIFYLSKNPDIVKEYQLKSLKRSREIFSSDKKIKDLKMLLNSQLKFI